MKKKHNFNMKDVIVSTIEGIEAKYKTRAGFIGHSTGIKSLDNVYGGFSQQSLWVISGRPSTGKTSLACQLLANSAIQSKKNVCFFSADQNTNAIVEKMLACSGKISESAIQRGRIEDAKWPPLIQSAGALSEASIDIFDDSWIKIPDVEAKLEVANYDLIVIDKFQSLVLLDKAAEGSSNRINELNQCVIELKSLAKKYNCTILITCDINKTQEQRTYRSPMLTDLKDFGGVLESYADVVIGLYWSGVDVGEWDDTKLVSLKNRFGPTIDIDIDYKRKYSSFSEKAVEPLPPPPPPRPPVSSTMKINR